MESEALGYGAEVDKKPDLREAFSCGPLEPAPLRLRQLQEQRMREVVEFCHQQTPWPGCCPGFEPALSSFHTEASSVGVTVLEILVRE